MTDRSAGKMSGVAYAGVFDKDYCVSADTSHMGGHPQGPVIEVRTEKNESCCSTASGSQSVQSSSKRVAPSANRCEQPMKAT
jgi:hypothetical protein